MKKTALTLLGLTWLSATSLLGAEPVQGKLVEIHSCEVFAGPCIISSEGTLGGRQSLQLWDFTGGSWQGVDFAGLQVAVLERANENLAMRDSRADRAVIYLPEKASDAQRRALKDYLQSENSQLRGAEIKSRIVPISMVNAADGLTYSIGEFASGKSVPMRNCDTLTCGSELWYEPGMPTSVFTVAVNGGSQVNEPLLDLKWSDFGRRSVFIGEFGATPTAKNLFVQSTDWCGSDRLF